MTWVWGEGGRVGDIIGAKTSKTYQFFGWCCAALFAMLAVFEVVLDVLLGCGKIRMGDVERDSTAKRAGKMLRATITILLAFL